MSDTPSLMRYGGFVAVVAVFALTMSDAIPGAPALAGWSGLQTSLGTDVTSTFPAMYVPAAPDTGCDWWDFGCFAGALFDSVLYIGGLVFYFVTWVTDVIFWLIYTVFAFASALFGAASLTFSGIPAWLQGILWILAAPLLILVLWAIVRLIRGDEG